VFYLSGNEIKIFPPNYLFSIALTGKVSVSNKKFQPFTAGVFGSDRCFTCQWLEIYVLFIV